MAHKFRSAAGATLVALTLTLALGCSSDAEEKTPGSGKVPAAVASGSGGADMSADEVADAIQDQMLTAIETTYSDRNAKARYEGDVVHIALDGDAEQDMAGFTDCRVFTQLVKEGESVVVEFPNGVIDCDDALSQ